MTQRRFLTRGTAVAAAALVPVLAASPAMAGPVTGTAVTSALLGPTTVACATPIFIGVACAVGWAAIGISWIPLPFLP